jgi:protein involved in ribonucleotide reduction
MTSIVYFSSVSGNTARFVKGLDRAAERIPLHARDAAVVVHEPYVLIVPTYGGGEAGGAVPKQVIRFLNVAENRARLRGVIGAGNTNFGTAYGAAGDVISAKCGVPMLYRFELFGTQDDLQVVRDGLDTL